MAMRPCPECGKEVSSEAQACQHCGFRFTGSYTKLAGWSALALIILFGVLERCPA
jgi:hypothetical protein